MCHEVATDNARQTLDALMLDGLPTTELDFLPSPESVAESMSTDELLDYINLESRDFFNSLPGPLRAELDQYATTETDEMLDAITAPLKTRVLSYCVQAVSAEITNQRELRS